jgi:putative membrane protein
MVNRFFRKSVFTPEEAKKLSDAITLAESKTSAEIAVTVLPASDHYAGARWRLATILATSGSAGMAYFRPDLPSLQIVEYSLILLVAGHLLAFVPWILRYVLLKKEREEEVRQRATQLIVEKSIFDTRGRNAVFIFISLLERRIEIIADKAVRAKTSAKLWDDALLQLSADIARGKLVEGLADIIRLTGEILTRHFPASQHENQLSDAPE